MLRQLCRRIIVGSGASEAMRESFGEMASSLLDTFERCFRMGICLGFRYTDREGATTQRRVEPHGIFVRLPFWYVLAVDIDNAAAVDDHLAVFTIVPAHAHELSK